MSIAEMFLKLKPDGNQLKVVCRDGSVLVRVIGTSPRDALKRLKHLVEARLAETENKGI
jgi:hypothetical protein